MLDLFDMMEEDHVKNSILELAIDILDNKYYGQILDKYSMLRFQADLDYEVLKQYPGWRTLVSLDESENQLILTVERDEITEV